VANNYPATYVLHAKRSFSAASNYVYAKALSVGEIIHLTLQESYNLPILTYAIAANYPTQQKQEMS
jgi:hypothetical protein